MVCDLPEHYMVDGEIHPAFQFIADVGVDWEQSKVLDGEVGDYVVIARQEKGTDKWFVGGISDENQRIVNVSFDFLEEGKTYEAKIYRDTEESHYDENPQAYQIDSMEVTSATSIDMNMASGGGFAISLMPK